MFNNAFHIQLLPMIIKTVQKKVLPRKVPSKSGKVADMKVTLRSFNKKN